MSGKMSEGAIIAIVGAVQFVNILDFMMVMPLGPDFARSLAIPESQLGYIGGAYTASASLAGIAGAFFLDRFDRKTALCLAVLGLSIGTVLGAFAWGLPSLMAARIVAGAFGGPATSLSLSIIADVVPAERRGKAMGAVMGAFSVASVVGVPMGLELARLGSWRTPFFAVALIGLVLNAAAFVKLPSMRGHLDRAQAHPALSELVRADTLLSLLMTGTVMFGMFILIPNISAYVMGNLHFPRERLGLLYFLGGIVSFGTMRVSGILVDKLGSAVVGSFGTLAMAGVTYAGFGAAPPLIPVMATFILFMTMSSFRNVSYNTLVTKVPRQHERARFGSVQSAVQHMAGALGAFASSRILTETPTHELVGMQTVARTSIGVTLCLIPMLFVVEARVKRQLAAAKAAAPKPAE
jgi:predicted MFS family arabinose efflux permease